MPQSLALPAFPLGRDDAMRTPALLHERGFSLRPLGNDDLAWLRDLYAASRAEEVAMLPWPDSAKRAFLEQQFALQHRHYMKHFADADYLAIEHRERGPVGRYYLQCVAPDHLIVDICLVAELHGQGIGSTLIRQSQEDAAALERGFYLHVANHNGAARRLYERLGFRAEGDGSGSHQPMRWVPALSGFKTAGFS
jgi:RimJ/RimL family protein N-acetyltransferase